VKRLLHVINEIGLGWMLAALTGTVAVFALGYWVLAGDGYLAFTFATDETPGFFDALYFSIVTISSLGYGDIRPLGPARILVGLEVMVGLAFFGILVAKVSSVKQDYILRRMYGEAVDDKLAALLRQLEEQRTLYRTTAALLMDGEIDPELTTTFRRDTPGVTFFSRYRQLLSEVSNLMIYEAGNSALFGVVDDSRLESVYDAVRGMLRRTTLLWERDDEAACDLVLCGNAVELGQICTLAEGIAVLGKRSSHNADIIEICQAILELSAKVRADVLPRL